MELPRPPDKLPPLTWDGRYWWTQDGHYWYDGDRWQPVLRSSVRVDQALRGRPSITQLIIGVGVVACVLMVGITALLISNNWERIFPDYGPGVTNAQINPGSSLQFDYTPNSKCAQLRFHYVFFDNDNNVVGTADGVGTHNLTPNEPNHITAQASDLSSSLNPRTVRFRVSSTCESS
jgi:hypothetical protein